MAFDWDPTWGYPITKNCYRLGCLLFHEMAHTTMPAIYGHKDQIFHWITLQRECHWPEGYDEGW
jgi:hypothetical protein